MRNQEKGMLKSKRQVCRGLCLKKGRGYGYGKVRKPDMKFASTMPMSKKTWKEGDGA